MPATDKFNQENPSQGEDRPEDNIQNTQVSLDEGQNLALDNGRSEVSSTTHDVEPTAETTQTPTTNNDDTSEAVQSTSSVDIGSDSLDEFKDPTPLYDEAVSKQSSSAPVSSAMISKGFQDAFAAFASASYRQPQEESPMDTSDIAESTEGQQDDVVSEAADSAGSATIEPVVSSAIDSGQVTTTGDDSLIRPGQDTEAVQSVAMELSENEEQTPSYTAPVAELEAIPAVEEHQVTEPAPQTQYVESQSEMASAGDSVYFIQMTDASGQIVTSIIDPNDIPSYSDSVVYKQCMRPDGEIETTIVYSGGMAVSHEEQPSSAQEETDSQVEQQIIYAHDLNGQLTPIDSAQSANDVAPPGKQFVYMQDSTGRIIRTIMDANQTMVPGQQVYYTQSEDGRIITSVMDSAMAGVPEDGTQQQSEQLYQQQQLIEESSVATQQQQESSTAVVGGTSSFNIDNSMSGLSMLAELSHLTAGQAPTPSGLSTEHRKSSTDTNSTDMDEFRPVAMVTRRVTGDEGQDSVSTDMAELKDGETDSDSLDQSSSLLQGDGTGQSESLVANIVSEIKGDMAHPSYTVSRDNLFVQWQNLDAMCWMDVVLIMLVYSPTLRPLVNLDSTHELATTLLITLLKANKQAQILLQNILKKSNGAELTGLQTGAGNIATIQDPKTSKLVCKENMDEIGKAINILYAMREKIWQALQPRLRCERGKHNSPVLVLPLLVREKPAIKQMFTMNYRYLFKCEKCGYSQDDSHTKILPSIPAVPADFNMKAPCFVRNCFECQAPNQRMVMKFEGLHDFVQMHFVKGLPHSRFDELSFDFNDDHYEVTAVVHYKNNPDHFIAWVRNAPGPAWMECDDLKSVITRYLHVSPNIPPSQVHMVMWERRLTAQHTLIMRDTEDTKLLASLVLTVQQPSTHQPTDPATRPTGQPSAPSIPVTSPAITQPQASTLLSGLASQTQTFQPYMSRGKGRGRGSRGTYTTRGRGAAIATPIIRKVTPTITPFSAPAATAGPRPHTSPQIVRLPLSALTGSGLNLRGVAPGGTRYVLVGNNAQGLSVSGPVATGAPSKVVVVRSQGGTGGMSAAQLLQLLQRSGAITQSGARITATVTSSSPHAEASVTPTRSYIIQQDGTITQPASIVSLAETTAGQISTLQMPSLASTSALVSDPVQEQGGDIQMEKEVNTEQITDEQISAASQTDFQTDISAAEHQLTSTSDTAILTSEPGTPAAATSQTETISSPVDVEVTGEQAAPLAKTVTISQGQQQQPSRYIQIPNPTGGGTLLCQLVMRQGKMVLVPVDKNTQAQISGTSVLKLENTSSSSGKITIRAPISSPQIVSVSSAGAVLAQLQQQQTQGIISMSQMGGTTTISTTGSPRLITVPGAAGTKKIQLITMPRSANTSQATKTILLSPTGSQQTVVSSSPSIISPRLLISPGEAATSSEGEVLSQSGNIVIRELKRQEGETISTLSASLGTTCLDAGRLTATSAVSLLRDVSRVASSGGTSLLTSPNQQPKPQESFRYILQGSNTTHILHTGTSAVQGGLGQTGKAFTALSSSGTIIGGQLTPSTATAAIGTSPIDQDLTLGDPDDSSSPATALSTQSRFSRDIDTTEYIPLGRSSPATALSTQSRFSRDIDTTEYIPLGRGRARTRGGRGGRSRGGRSPRGGRGRAQLWSVDTEYIPPTHLTSRKISTLSDLRQIGAHVIEAGAEAVDGVPVVSIPDYTATDMDHQTEALSAAQSIVAEGTVTAINEAVSELINAPVTSLVQENLPALDTSAGSQGPRVITQPIPSIKANHGFDILTQGILGSGNNTRPALPPPKQSRSLLTGVASSASSLLASISASSVSSSSTFSDIQSSLPSQTSATQAIGQAEIDMLIEAAEAAAKPAKLGQRKSFDSDSNQPSTETALSFEKDILTAGHEESSQFGVNDLLDKNDAVEDDGNETKPSDGNDQGVSAKPEEHSRVMNVDESLVSAAERYRMPVELFQPDDESPEKTVKPDEIVNKLDLPTRLFQDSEVSSHEDEISASPQHQGKELAVGTLSPEDSKGKTVVEPMPGNAEEVRVDPDSAIDYNEIVQNEGSSTPQSVKKSFDRRTGRRRGRGGKRGGRRKSDMLPGTEEYSESVPAFPGTSAVSEVAAVGPADNLFAEKVTQVMSSPGKDSSPHLRGRSPANKSNSIGGFATDLLMEYDIKETVEMQTPEQQDFKENNQEEKRRGKSKASAKSKGREEDSPAESKEDMALHVSETGVKLQNGDKKISTPEPTIKEQTPQQESPPSAQIAQGEKVVRKYYIYHPPFIRHKKEPADWHVRATDSEELIPVPPFVPFNYKVLTGKLQKSTRHPSLGSAEESYTSPLPMPPLQNRVDPTDNNLLKAVVKRRSSKSLQKPDVDPAREPTVIPLVADDETDPSCTGGSVVTSPVSGEIFTGVVVRRKKERADWSFALDEDEDINLQSSLTGEEKRVSEKRYCKQLLTVLYMEAGDFTAMIGDCVSDNEGENVRGREESLMKVEEIIDKVECSLKSVTGKVEGAGGDPENSGGVHVDSIKTDTPELTLSKGKHKKRGRPCRITSPSTNQPSKRARSSNIESATEFDDKKYFPVPDLSVVAHPTTRVNGIDTVVSSPTHSSQMTSDTESLSLNSQTTGPAGLSPPSRRSGRTPIPSKRILDALEDAPVRSFVKNRRSSQVSSEDEEAGFNSSDLPLKKQKRQSLTSL